MVYAYPVVLLKDENGTVIASVPDVPGTLTVGASRNEALARVHGALLTMLAARIEDHKPIPQPSLATRGNGRRSWPPLATAKLSVYTAMRTRRVSKEALAQRLNWTKPASRACWTSGEGRDSKTLRRPLRLSANAW